MSECTLEMIEGVRCMTALLLLLIHDRRCAVLQLCCCCLSLESGDFVGAGGGGCLRLAMARSGLSCFLINDHLELCLGLVQLLT